MFVLADPQINAFAIGHTKPIIVVTSGAIDILSENDLRFVIGREISHMNCENTLYHYIADNISGVVQSLAPIGALGNALDTGIQLALLNWSRVAEFSADRAGLLAVQDASVAVHALGILAAGSRKLAEQINVDELLKQADEFDGAGSDIVSNFYKFSSRIGQTHPYTIVRIKEAMKWASNEMPQFLADPKPKSSPDYFE